MTTRKTHSLYKFFQEPQFLNKIVDTIGDEVMLIDSQGRIVYVNDTTVKAIGFPRPILLKKKIYQLFKQKMTFHQWKQQHFGWLKESRRALSVQVERITKSKKVQTIEVTAVYLKYKSEEYLLSLGRDITARLKLQKELQDSQDRYRVLTESAADGIFTADLEGRITYANQALLQLTKIPLEKSFGQSFKKYITRKTLSKALSCFAMAVKGIYRVREEIEILDQDKQVIPVEVNVSPLYKDEKIIGVHAIVRDIRRRKEIENMVRESERKYRDLFEAATDALILTDAKGFIVGVNREAESLFGRPKIELIGTHKSQLFPAVKAEQCEKMFAKTPANQAISCDMEINRRDGQHLIVSASGRWIHIGEDELFLIRLVDLSSRVGQEERLRELSKMQALGLFVSGTAQEVMHPLEAIRVLVRKILEKYQAREFEYIGFREYEEIMKSIEHIANRVDNCCEITEKLLKLNKKRAGLQKKRSDLNQVIKSTSQILSQQMSLSNIQLTLKLSPSLPLAAVEEGEVSEIMSHIVANAIQAMPSGGDLHIKSYWGDDQMIHLEVKDEGVGIPKEDLPRIFEPFFTTKQRGVGKNIGLGLSIVYSIVKGAGGDISVRSSLTHGTIVSILLPAVGKITKAKKHKLPSQS